MPSNHISAAWVPWSPGILRSDRIALSMNPQASRTYRKPTLRVRGRMDRVTRKSGPYIDQDTHPTRKNQHP